MQSISRLAMTAAAVAAFAAASPSAAQCSPEEAAKLLASDGAQGDNCAWSVAIDGDLAVLGAQFDDSVKGKDAGSIYVFVRTAGVWKQQAHLFASDGAADDYFGGSVAISGGLIVVGAPYDDTPKGVDSGSAYVYEYSFGGLWLQKAKLTAPDGAPDDQFGHAVGIDGETIVVGAPMDDSPGGVDAGSAYVFTRYEGAWQLQDSIAAPDGAAGDQFGWSAAISGSTVVVGAPKDNTPKALRAGSAHVFVRKFLGIWVPQAQLFASDADHFDAFGWAVAIAGDSAIVGARDDNTAGGTKAGSAYVFFRNGLDAWNQQAHLFASDGAQDDQFGGSVAIAGDAAVVGAWSDDTAGGVGAGSAHLFLRDGNVWKKQAKLMADDGAAFDAFGLSAAISANTALVGAPFDGAPGKAVMGSAYIFDLHCPICYADCDKSGNLDIDDFICFQSLYATGDKAADCDKSGTIDIDDFICFQTQYGLGCP